MTTDPQDYYPQAALWAPAEAAQEMACEGKNVIVAAKYGWKSRYNQVPKALRVLTSIWDKPFALAASGEDLWVLVPTFVPYRQDEPEGYIWVAGNRRSAKSVLSNPNRTDAASFYFVRDWKEVDFDWIEKHLIQHLDNHRLNYDKLPDRLWV